MTIRDRIRAAISDSYYDARNDGLTMEHAADQATAKVMQIISEVEDIDDENLRTWHQQQEPVDTVLYMVERAEPPPFLNVGEGEYGIGHRKITDG